MRYWSLRTWAFISWTLLAIGVGIVGRFTFAKPMPKCSPDDPLCLHVDVTLPFLVIVVFVGWLAGLGVIAIIAAVAEGVSERRRWTSDEPERTHP